MVIKAIRDRLKLLGSKKVIKGICQDCGKPFELFKRRFRTYKLCYECHRKRYSKKE